MYRAAKLNHILPHLPIHIYLPVAISLYVKASEPAAAAYVGVNADGMAQIGGDVGFLGGVTANHGLT